jgi:hypothetical protein
MGIILIIAGAVLIALGLATSGNFGPLGRLPGDLTFHQDGTTVYIPIMTSIILSIILNVIVWIVSKYWER